jgi:orotidine-5'-phosphate decarboxylase
MTDFIEKLAAASTKNKSMVCVGLDPDSKLMPPGIGVFEFNKAIIEATSDLVCCYKPNFAFYEALGNDGLDALKKTVACIPDGIPCIADAKRGDIGNTARAYASAIFDHFGFDAATASPYLGYDSLEPFIERKDKGVFILCRTSNAGAADFQSLEVTVNGERRPLFEVVADTAGKWNKYGNIGLVVGATYPDELKTIHAAHPDMPLLIPGIGAQGGDLETTVKNGADKLGQKTVINSSRGILYASNGKDFAAAARKECLKMRDAINAVRK